MSVEEDAFELGPWGELRIERSLEDIYSWQSAFPIRRIVTEERVWLAGERLLPEDWEGLKEAIVAMDDAYKESRERKA
jgi:hypothetical protein